jgi:hypothetical protein
VRKGLIWLCVLILFSGCALFTRKPAEIVWPEKIDYMQAACELDMAWKDMSYSGSMSLTLKYPEEIQLEVYGPFGDTAVYLKKDGDAFLLVAGDERYTDEKGFERKFSIRLKDFIDDIARRGAGESPGASVKRDTYTVTYSLGGRTNRICWEGRDGRICVRFLEARFDRD